MTQESLITEQLRQAVGRESAPVVVEINKTFIKRFAEGVGDPNPLFGDEETARGSRFGGVVAPPSLFCAAFLIGELPFAPIETLLPPRALDGGGEWEILRPVRAGDTITVVNKLTDLSERQSRIGPMLVVSMESTWQNQRQEVVAKARFTIIRY